MDKTEDIIILLAIAVLFICTVAFVIDFSTFNNFVKKFYPLERSPHEGVVHHTEIISYEILHHH
jgi:hypothetical protein